MSMVKVRGIPRLYGKEGFREAERVSLHSSSVTAVEQIKERVGVEASMKDLIIEASIQSHRWEYTPSSRAIA